MANEWNERVQDRGVTVNMRVWPDGDDWRGMFTLSPGDQIFVTVGEEIGTFDTKELAIAAIKEKASESVTGVLEKAP